MFPAKLIGNNENVLFHGVKAHHALQQLNEGVIEGYTHQRYWNDGLRRKDNHPDCQPPRPEGRGLQKPCCLG